MFSMFVDAPPASTPVNLVYFEQRPFGPYGKAAGESSNETGFSDALWMKVAQSAPPAFRTLKVICNGTLRVLGPQAGFPATDTTAPCVVELVPAPREMRELERLCAAQKTETPRRFLYHGVDAPSLTVALEGYLTRMSSIRVLDQSTNRMVPLDPVLITARFMSGELTVPVIEAGLAAGLPLGQVSDRNLHDGMYTFGIEAQTGAPLVPAEPSWTVNRLDPVTLFGILASGKLTDGRDAIEPAQRTNSWMDNVTRSRVLITFRDEWNSPRRDDVFMARVTGPGQGQFAAGSLDAVQTGTVVAPSGWDHYTCQIGVINQVKLTQIPSDDAAAGPLTIEATAPAHRVLGTVRPEDWFQDPYPPYTGMPGNELARYTEGNIVTPLIDGIPMFAQLVADLRELDDSTPPGGRFPDNFALFADWFMDDDFPLVPGDPTTKLKALLAKGVDSPHKLIVRALVWAVKDTGAILDIATLDKADPHYTEAWPVDFPLNQTIAFHWKSSVIRNRHGTFAYVGGIDINPNRLDDSDHGPGHSHYHDVHCRIQGPAVADVTSAFIARWFIHGLGSEVTDAIEPTVTTPPGVPATQMVQIARTFSAGTGAGFQPWSPDGEQSIWNNIRRAIERARRYIYIEDQYVVAPMLREALQAALADPNKKLDVVIVMPEHAEADVPVVANEARYDRHRYLVLKDLITDHRVSVFTIKDHYVHTKATIVDDVFATIGSANMNNRGFNHDAELNAFVLDGRIEGGVRKFARDLRTRLWAEHLGMPLTPASFAALQDVDRALDIMRNKRPPKAWIAPYAVGDVGSLLDPVFDGIWNSVIDPVGF